MSILKNWSFGCVALALAAQGCNGSVDGDERAVTLSVEPVLHNAAGYAHALVRSRFDLGALVETRLDGAFERHLGSHGVFATRKANGAVLAIPNADAPARLLPSYGGSAEAHNTYVKDYFLSLGIPADQIFAVHANTHGFGHSMASDADRLPKPERSSYQTVLLRAVGGIRVVDSVAWARVDPTGSVVAEEIYWPEIPASVVQTAQTMRARLLHPQLRARLLDGLGAKADDVEVVIRHSGSTVDAAPTFHAAYDVLVKAGTTSYRRHLDAELHDFRLEHELVKTAPATAMSEKLPL
jgi:hypothetical protein